MPPIVIIRHLADDIVRRFVAQKCARTTVDQREAYFSLVLIKHILHNKNVLSVAALDDRTRRRIIEMLVEGELSSGDIANRFDLSAPAISQHLKVLKRAQLVHVRVDGQRRIYGLDPAGFAELENWLAGVKPSWQGRTARLARQLRAPAGGSEKRNKSHKKKGSHN